ncbi:HNH endonuclease [Thermomonospora cellulosilytica]|uniref:5-methylcytosine-specific restriction endonuclease McrA n=1 Tax=Thermomonospora cellulosilytica TaxID=1411118 RepID=A0A7W3MU91_9ACTN|nr:HNH endonuclease signature motif containing protein [Thermomonospora cellulosilytica]MBA9002022.1 5-methylcytosine-specific restriction endonuclease McrA [Thermomonospora cellulosilytica]
MAAPWRSTPLPPDWKRRRLAVLERDGHTCQIAGPRCTGRATEVDHTGAADDHRLEALRAVCSACHASRTGRQGAAARGPRPSRRRPPEPHPGILA